MNVETMRLLSATTHGLRKSEEFALATPQTTLVVRAWVEWDEKAYSDIRFSDSVLPEELDDRTPVMVLQDHRHTLLVTDDPDFPPHAIWQPPTDSNLVWRGGTVPVSTVYWIKKKLWKTGEITIGTMSLYWLREALHVEAYALASLDDSTIPTGNAHTPRILMDTW